MTYSPEGCGVLEHTPECLCDVKLTEPYTTPNYLAIPYEVLNGEALAHFGKWDGTLTHWFELRDRTRQPLEDFRRNQVTEEWRGHFARKLDEDVFEYLVDGIRLGKQPTPLKNELYMRFGVTIHKSYVTHLRKRLTQRGQL